MSKNSFADASTLVFAAKSSLVREEVWLELNQAAFDIVLDGLSKIRKISIEGRAAMLRDVIALESGLSAVHICYVPRGKPHIEVYISASSLGEDALMLWIRQNWQSYAYRHMHGIVSQAFSSVMSLSSKRLKDAVAVLDELYQFDGTKEQKKEGGFKSLAHRLHQAGSNFDGDSASAASHKLAASMSNMFSKFQKPL